MRDCQMPVNADNEEYGSTDDNQSIARHDKEVVDNLMSPASLFSHSHVVMAWRRLTVLKLAVGGTEPTVAELAMFER